MRLIPGTRATVKLDGEERRLTLVASSGDGERLLNVKAPLAVLLGMMGVGDTSKAWTPPVAGAVPMRVELMKVEAVR